MQKNAGKTIKKQDQNNKTKQASKTGFLSNLFKTHSLLAVITFNIVLVLVNLLILSMLPSQVNSIITTRSEIMAQKLQNQSAKKLFTDLQAKEESKLRLYTALPDKEMLLQVIEVFEGLNQEAVVQGFSFQSETPVPDENDSAYLPVNLILEGSIAQTMSALYSLQQSPYLIKFNQTIIETPGGISEQVTVRVALSLYVRQPFVDKN